MLYKKGCQEKNSAATGVEIVARDPAHCSFVFSEDIWLVVHLVRFSALVTMLSSLREQQARLVASEATMVLSEARGLWLFLVVRGGIACKWVTRCRSTRGRSH